MSAFLSLHTTATKTRVKKKEIRMIWHGVRMNSQQDLQREREGGKKRKETLGCTSAVGAPVI